MAWNNKSCSNAKTNAHGSPKPTITAKALSGAHNQKLTSAQLKTKIHDGAKVKFQQYNQIIFTNQTLTNLKLEKDHLWNDMRWRDESGAMKDQKTEEEISNPKTKHKF